MRTAVHAEWTKLRTVIAPRRLLLATVAATVTMGVAISSVVTRADDPVRLSLTGVVLGQAPVVVLAVLAISGEYGSRMITTTLAAVPGRLTVLAAKAVVLAAAVAAAGTVAVLASLLAGRPVPTDGPTLRAAVGTVGYLVLIALLGLGVATAVRDTATSIGAVLGLLYLTPVLATTIGDPHWQRLLGQLAPMTAGLAVQATVNLDDLPIGPLAGLGVTAGWATAALLIGGLLLHLRDA